MNRKQKLLWVTAVFVGLFSCLPVVRGAPVVFSAPAGNYSYIMVYTGTTENIKITINATGVIDVFLTNSSADMASYLATGIIPNTPTVKGRFTGFLGNVCASCPELACHWYLCFGNYHGATTVTGTYELGEGTCPSEIPSFEIFFVFFTLFATFGIIWSKKKLTI